MLKKISTLKPVWYYQESLSLIVVIVKLNLSAIQVGETAIIQALHGDPALHCRLEALGFSTGKSVMVIRRGRFGGPMQVRVGMTDVILRLSDAARIDIQQKPAPAAP